MLATTQQMSRVHVLGDEMIPPLSTVKEQTSERVGTFKRLGTWINENLK